MPAAIEVQDLIKDYGTTRALAGVSLQVEQGEVFGYLGANGAGKTTTIKILTGLLRPTSGTARVCGFSLQDEPLEAKARLGYLPESGALYEKLSPREYLRFVGRLYRMPDDLSQARSTQWLEFFRLAPRADEPIRSLSKGNKQKICWMAALIHDPEVLVLDEPLSGLDVETVAQVKDLLASLASRGRTVFYSSHLVDVVEKVCTRIGVIHRGQLVAEGTVEEVRAAAGTASLEQALLQLWKEPA